MKYKKFLIIPLALILSSCQSLTNLKNKGLIDEENLNIVREINNLATDTFLRKDPILDSAMSDLEDDNSPKLKSEDMDELRKNIEPYINMDPKAKWIYMNFYNIPDREALTAGNNPDTIEFIYNLNNGINNFPMSAGSSLNLGRKTPLFLQWDNRWAYKDLPPKNIGISGCGSTSMAMILSRIKNDSSITPLDIANDAKTYMTDDGISWNFFQDGASMYDYNIKGVENNEDAMIKALEKGPILVSVGRGYFTLYGHIFVIDSYQDGKFLINDPNSIKNSVREWTYEEINDQIVQMWNIFS